MKLLDSLEIVISTFINNKMRTLLTVLGVSIGMGAIIFLVSFGYGLQKLTIDRISNSEALLTFSLSPGSSKIIHLNDEKIEEIKKLTEIEKTGLSYAFSGGITSGATQTDVTVYAVDQGFLDLENLILSAGKEFNDEMSDKTLILSSAASEALGISDPNELIDKEVVLVTYYDSDNLEKNTTQKLKVAAVSDDSGSNVAYLPISKLTIPENVDYTLVKSKISNPEFAKAAREKLEGLGLRVYSVAETVNSINRVFNIVQYILFGFGLIALLVASLGMFNTLTISLLERTREVGIMKALGATSSGIYKIFLIEAIAMGTMGGALGVFFGWFLGVVINTVVSRLATNLGGSEMDIFYTPALFAVMVFVFSVIIGFLTGFYPARRAAKLNALDSLRYE